MAGIPGPEQNRSLVWLVRASRIASAISSFILASLCSGIFAESAREWKILEFLAHFRELCWRILDNVRETKTSSVFASTVASSSVSLSMFWARPFPFSFFQCLVKYQSESSINCFRSGVIGIPHIRLMRIIWIILSASSFFCCMGRVLLKSTKW